MFLAYLDSSGRPFFSDHENFGLLIENHFFYGIAFAFGLLVAFIGFFIRVAVSRHISEIHFLERKKKRDQIQY